MAVGGTPDLLKHGESGFLVDSDDEAAMANAIWALYTDKAKTLRLAQNARDWALQNFGLDAMVHSYESLFSDRLSVGPG